LRFDVEDVGKHVKGSKKRYCWDFSLNGRAHSLVLDFSFISGKVKITVDRKILLENDLPADVSFQYPFKLDGFALNIIQQGDSFELRINNKVFSHLYTQQRTNAEFKKYEDEVKDIKVDLSHLNPQNKKISLNIGAFGGNIKKKKEATDSQSWNAFAGGSFPSYFADN
jgi:Fas apoptotic inhibitory molecule (FAIM1)